MGESSAGSGRGLREDVHLLLSVISDLFAVSFCTYAVLAVIETIDKGWVSNFFDLDILLGVMLASGVITLLRYPSGGGYEAFLPAGKAYRSWGWCLGLIAAALTWRTTRGLGVISLFISLGSGAVVVLLSGLLGDAAAEE